jgi:hypothetical protein
MGGLEIHVVRPGGADVQILVFRKSTLGGAPKKT